MLNELVILVFAAMSLGFFHTILGPDHYLPFIAMSRSGKWSLRKTTLVTAICGIGHVCSSIVLGFLGISMGIAVSKLELVESFRGSVATWILITFGLLYFIWGVRRGFRQRTHEHSHAHGGIGHTHQHNHTREHMHVHEGTKRKNVTPWVLFTIFLLGPCEPLIPLLMYPAANNSLFAVVLVSLIFGVVTIVTMLGIVLLTIAGINIVPASRMGRYSHAIAGAIICMCGISILLLGV